MRIELRELLSAEDVPMHLLFSKEFITRNSQVTDKCGSMFSLKVYRMLLVA